jgi:DNA polymerase-3 subunit epsilon
MRQIVLDTETTGLEPERGHRVIEIGAVELEDRRPTGRQFHEYVNPGDQEIDAGALAVHGITRESLADKPLFDEVAADLLRFLGEAELVIHNAPFDLGFLDYEFRLLDRERPPFSERFPVVDTLVLARELHPGQRNSLDALCKRYEIDNAHRTLHGALLDAEILADVYLAMTGGQVDLGLTLETRPAPGVGGARKADRERPALRVLRASDAERERHEERLAGIEKASGRCLWWELEGRADRGG